MTPDGSFHTAGPARLPRPTFANVPEYGARLGDAGFWGPYVTEVLVRHGLPLEPPQPGVVGTFPTFLVGRYVVKLFYELFSGAVSHEVERSVHRLLAARPQIPAPALIAEGRLFDDGWPWPYLVTTRLAGTAWRDAGLQPAERQDLARRLGTIVRQVHQLPAPGGAAWQADRLPDRRSGCVDRHRRWGTLPGHLVDQLDRFLVVVEPSPVRCLVHADLHEDHLFVDRRDGARLAGIIDWGDALVTDPYYELPALHLGTFKGDKRLLGAFLEGYAWEIGADFAQRAMTMALLHEFNVLDDVGEIVSVNTVPSLDALAALLWELP